MPRAFDLPSVQERFNHLEDSLVVDPNSVILDQQIDPLVIGRGRLLAGCIRGNARTILGTSLNFNDLKTIYDNNFQIHIDWTSHFSENSVFGYWSNDASIIINELNAESLSYQPECADYLVCYSISFSYSNPSRMECGG
jgi:hypothetical protein